jgi:hypothetical protein
MERLMGIMAQANKLKGKDKEVFLKEYHEARKRLEEAQAFQPKRKTTRKSSPRNGKVITRKLDDLEQEHV